MERQRRNIAFAEYGSLFGEPAWDVLLCAFIGSERGKPLTISEIATAADLPMTTTQRHVLLLEKSGFLITFRDPHDTRRVLILLSPTGDEKMRAFLEKNHLPMPAYPVW
jgi:DNA-binding MarR family transcriptional regulator